MSNYNMFIDENIDTTMVNIETAIENAGLAYMDGDLKEADRYKNAVEKIYQEIGKAVLSDRKIAEQVQALLRVKINTRFYYIQARVNETNEIIDCVCADSVLHMRGSEIKAGNYFMLYQNGLSQEGELLRVEEVNEEAYNTLSTTCEIMRSGAIGEGHQYEWLEITRDRDVIVIYAVEGTPDIGISSSGCLYEWKGNNKVHIGDVVIGDGVFGRECVTVQDVRMMKASEAAELMKAYEIEGKSNLDEDETQGKEPNFFIIHIQTNPKGYFAGKTFVCIAEDGLMSSIGETYKIGASVNIYQGDNFGSGEISKISQISKEAYQDLSENNMVLKSSTDGCDVWHNLYVKED